MGTHPIFESDFDCLTDFLLSKSHALQKMYKLDIPLDQKEAAAINRRKQNEEERQNRIFNARTRLIGVDKEALNHQVNDRNKMQQMDQQRHDAYAREMIKNDKLGVLYQERQERDVRELQKSLNEFRLQHQRPETRREWDMNNPEYLRIDKPARTSDDDKTLGISSAQVFDGEDLSGHIRNTAQQKQRADWAAAQIEERARADQLRDYSDHLYQQKQIELDQQGLELQRQEMECRRAVATATKQFNAQQAQERKQREAEEKAATLQDNLTEIKNQVFGDTLTENPAVARSAFGSHRVITDRWKGMNQTQIDSIRETQASQVQERKMREDEAARLQKEWDTNRIKMAKAGTLMERAEKRERREIQKRLVEENKRMAKEQAERLNDLDHVVYTNRPQDSYFSQFNTTSR